MAVDPRPPVHRGVRPGAAAGGGRRDAVGEPELLHVRDLVGGKAKLFDYGIVAIPGGFSYGDDVGAGRILANEIKGGKMDKVEDQETPRKKEWLGL